MSALVDTGALLAAIVENDDLHDICVLALEEEVNPLCLILFYLNSLTSSYVM
jgi:hypothetical protein